VSEFIKAATTDEIPVGAKKVVVVGREQVVLINLDGQYFALADVCTHDGGPLGEGRLQNGQITCPRHGARFDVRSGAALSMPAFEAVPTFRVRVDGVDILVEES
jgi:3-phenylpropionate/trans-cinnamate dioxygenase ferredoxin component